MNNPAPAIPSSRCCQPVLDRVEAYVRNEPAKAMAAAFGVGLLLKILPAQALVRPIGSLAVKVLPPALLGLGLLKAAELCCQKGTGPACEHPPERQT